MIIFHKTFYAKRWIYDLGKLIVIKRKAVWSGDSNYLYTYSNTTKQALPWTRELSELKQIVEERAETKFNSCLLNLYHDGNEGVAWHSDDEKALGNNATIASLSPYNVTDIGYPSVTEAISEIIDEF